MSGETKRWGISILYKAEQHVVLEFPTEKEARVYVYETPMDELQPSIISDCLEITEVHELCWMEHGSSEESEGCVCERPKGHNGPCSCDALNPNGTVNK